MLVCPFMTMLIESIGPYSLELSLRAAEAFAPQSSRAVETAKTLLLPVRFDGTPAVLGIRQVATEPACLEVEVHSSPRRSRSPKPPAGKAIAATAARLVNAALDLRPFYRLVEDHDLLGPLSASLYGLKAFRPPTLFEMLVIAVIEQQISLAAAYHIRERLVRRFGDSVEGLVAFPTPKVLAEAPAAELVECGVSRRKAEYIGGLAGLVQNGAVDPESWENLPDEDVREGVTSIRGFGRWSADYLLVRGLGRPDVVPADDLGIQTLLGRVLGVGKRLSPEEVQRVLLPFAPFRGLAVFYILAGSRLSLF
ncbi:MAG: hypothetical protein M1274_05430 [Actinobacteria bacterium]|nr:hypothetical protein [Actinomycetota bacterium]